MHFWFHQCLQHDDHLKFPPVLGIENIRTRPCPANMEAGTSLRCCFLPKVHEEAVNYDQVHYRDAIAKNYFTTNPGFFSDDTLCWRNFIFDRNCRAFFGHSDSGSRPTTKNNAEWFNYDLVLIIHNHLLQLFHVVICGWCARVYKAFVSSLTSLQPSYAHSRLT